MLRFRGLITTEIIWVETVLPGVLLGWRPSGQVNAALGELKSSHWP